MRYPLKRLLVLLLLCITLSGCATGTGTRWYAPATWFSHSAASKADKAEAAVVVAEDKAVSAAQREAHKTQVALLTVPASRSTGLAIQSNDNAVALLDQVAGPLTAADMVAIREQVAALVSENAQIRQQAEAKEKQDKSSIEDVSSRLQAAIRDSRTANDGLRSAFERENALANELRTERAWKWILGSVTVLALGAWLYVRYFLGGISNAVGGLLARLEQENPTAADDARSILDDLLHHNPRAQATIAAAYSKNT